MQDYAIFHMYFSNIQVKKIGKFINIGTNLTQVMKGNEVTLPPAAFFIVRFHSFYALHRSGAYKYLMNKEDEDMLKWLQVFKLVSFSLHNSVYKTIP
jgi:inositol oxygenase